MTRWFTSDHHLGHENIIDFCERPWGDVHAMTAGLIERHNRVVAPDDEVYFVGDMAWNNGALEDFAYFNGRKFLIPGNHDDCHPMHGAHRQARHRFEEAGFTILDTIVPLRIGETEVTVCHFPYEPDAFDHSKHRQGHPDRFAGNRPIDADGWLICGHIHNNWQIKGKQINVGVDVWDWAPVSEDLIAAVIKVLP